MWKKKGQGIVEYALILAFVVAVGGVLYANGNLADSIRSVFSNVNTLIEEASKPPLEAATTAQDIIERLRQGRYDGLADDELNHEDARFVMTEFGYKIRLTRTIYLLRLLSQDFYALLFYTIVIGFVSKSAGRSNRKI